jgi:hypothetical protein
MAKAGCDHNMARDDTPLIRLCTLVAVMAALYPRIGAGPTMAE